MKSLTSKVAVIGAGSVGSTYAFALMESGLVEHLRADGFTFRPRHPVEWLVCDMVDKPARVLDLVARWFERGDCRAAIFNLKLPMKRRFEEVQRARAILQDRLSRLEGSWRISVRQLFHDREEVTFAVLPERA